MSDTITPPWTEVQVANLNDYQQSGRFHPYTCPGRGDGRHEWTSDLGVLVATTDGWVCPSCPYTQRWAHRASGGPVVRDRHAGQQQVRTTNAPPPPSQPPAPPPPPPPSGRTPGPDLGAALYALHHETGRLLGILDRDGHLWAPAPDRLPPGLERLPLMTAEVLLAASRQPVQES